jgi:hypothetical protein
VQATTDYIIARNIKRRHLNAGRLAFLALALEPYFAAQAKKRQRESGGDRKSEQAKSVPQTLGEPMPRKQRETSAQVGKALGVSGASVQKAKAIGASRDSVQKAAKICRRPSLC